MSEVNYQAALAVGGTTDLGMNRLKVSIDLSSATWNTVATQEVFVVTGLVRALVIYRVTETLTSGGAATLCFGREGSTNAYAAAQAYTALVAGVTIVPGGTVAAVQQTGAVFALAAQNADIVVEGLDLGFEIAGAAVTDGTIEAICYWTPLSDGATVTAGAGGTL